MGKRKVDREMEKALEEMEGQEAGRLTFIQGAEGISNMAWSIWQMAAGRVC